ncbi:hypothetical protein [Photorhabdus australis]|uniref:hypothetical protein n=1 Tax=Photorhabdus australis TaxID=286156 RepID=UPI0030DCBFF2
MLPGIRSLAVAIHLEIYWYISPIKFLLVVKLSLINHQQLDKKALSIVHPCSSY